jgi:amidase
VVVLFFAEKRDMKHIYSTLFFLLLFYRVMAQNNILFASATELAEKIRTRELTSFEVVSAFINQIEKQNNTYHALVLVDKENALLQARLADQALDRNELWGKLHGVPVTLKDNYKTRGLTTTAAYKPLKNQIPVHDAEIVRLLK